MAAADPAMVIAARLQAMQAQDAAAYGHYVDMKNLLVAQGIFPAEVGGAADLFLFGNGNILLHPRLAAETTFEEVKDIIDGYNRAHRGFGQSITMTMSTFVQTLIHHYRLLRAYGDPMVLAALRADLPNITGAQIDETREHLRTMTMLKKEPRGEVPEMEIKEKFRHFLVAFQNFLSKIVGAHGIPLTYLLVPQVIDIGNPDHVQWARVPLVGAAYNRDNAVFYQILTSIVMKTKYKVLLLASRHGQDGRKIWLQISKTELGEGNMFQTLATLKLALSAVYTGKNANLSFVTFYTDSKMYYDALAEFGERTLDFFKIEHAWSHIDIDNPRVLSLFAAEKCKHTVYEDFMDALHVHVVASGIETRASDTKLGDRKVAALGAGRPLMIEGVDCSEYVKPSGRIHVPGVTWKKHSKEFQAAVIEHNAAKKKRGAEGAERPDKRQRQSRDREVKELKAKLAKYEGDDKTGGDADGDKGSNTGGLIASARGQ